MPALQVRFSAIKCYICTSRLQLDYKIYAEHTIIPRTTQGTVGVVHSEHAAKDHRPHMRYRILLANFLSTKK